MGSESFLVCALLLLLAWGCAASEVEEIRLPPPRHRGEMSVEEAISRRRSCRDFSPQPLTLAQLAQLLWACQGITDSIRGFRAAPSAGATYPFETYVVVGAVEGLKPGLYRYNVRKHALELLRAGDIRAKLARACLSQDFIASAPATIVLAAEYERTTRRYGERGYRYVAMEAGHIGENLHLQCEALGLGTVMVGAFFDNEVKELLGVPEEPLYVMPVGKPAR